MNHNVWNNLDFTRLVPLFVVMISHRCLHIFVCQYVSVTTGYTDGRFRSLFRKEFCFNYHIICVDFVSFNTEMTNSVHTIAVAEVHWILNKVAIGAGFQLNYFDHSSWEIDMGSVLCRIQFPFLALYLCISFHCVTFWTIIHYNQLKVWAFTLLIHCICTLISFYDKVHCQGKYNIN